MLALVGEVVAQWRGVPLLVLCLSRNMPNLSKRVPARLRRHTIELDLLLQSDAERLLKNGSIPTRPATTRSERRCCAGRKATRSISSSWWPCGRRPGPRRRSRRRSAS